MAYRAEASRLRSEKIAMQSGMVVPNIGIAGATIHPGMPLMNRNYSGESVASYNSHGYGYAQTSVGSVGSGGRGYQRY